MFTDFSPLTATVSGGSLISDFRPTRQPGQRLFMWLNIRQEGLDVGHEAESILGTVGSSVSWGVKNTKGWKSVSVIGFSQDNLTGVQNWIAGVQEHEKKKKKTHIILFLSIHTWLLLVFWIYLPWKLSLHTKVFSLSVKFTETNHTEQVRFFKLLKLFTIILQIHRPLQNQVERNEMVTQHDNAG